MSSPSSSFSQVIFNEIPETYGTDECVICRYTISGEVRPSAKDWIGLYRVGWNSIRDFLTYQWITVSDDYKTETDAESICTFDKDVLPTNDMDFFQFCYVNSNGKVCGVSPPFQFGEELSDDFVVIDETSSMLILGSKTQPIITNGIHTTVHENDSLKKEEEEVDVEMHEEMKRKDEEIKNLRLDVEQLKTKLVESEKLSEQLMEEECRYKFELNEIKNELKSVKESLEEAEKRNADLIRKESDLKEIETKLTMAVKNLEREFAKKNEELNEAMNEEKSCCVCTSGVLDAKETALDELTKRLNKMSTENSQLKKRLENMTKLQSVNKFDITTDGENAVEEMKKSDLSATSGDGTIYPWSDLKNLAAEFGDGSSTAATSGDGSNATATSGDGSNATVTAGDGSNATAISGDGSNATTTSGDGSNATATSGDGSNATATSGDGSNATVTSVDGSNATVTSGDASNATVISGDASNATVTSGDASNATVISGDASNATELTGDDGSDVNAELVRSMTTCPTCFLVFRAGTRFDIIRDHIEAHNKVCPMCHKQFELHFQQDEFEKHVAQHFKETMRQQQQLTPRGGRMEGGKKICPICDKKFSKGFQSEFEAHVYKHF